jgi:hypothetical protein
VWCDLTNSVGAGFAGKTVTVSSDFQNVGRYTKEIMTCVSCMDMEL